MLTQVQIENIDLVLKRFEYLEKKPVWDSVDNCMVYLDSIDNNQLNCEADLVLEKHNLGNPRCRSDHPIEKCLVPRIIKAVDSIIAEHLYSGTLSKDHRYILMYYIALNHAGDILY